MRTQPSRVEFGDHPKHCGIYFIVPGVRLKGDNIVWGFLREAAMMVVAPAAYNRLNHCSIVPLLLLVNVWRGMGGG